MGLKRFQHHCQWFDSRYAAFIKATVVLHISFQLNSVLHS
jgi:hypothetical protein